MIRDVAVRVQEPEDFLAETIFPSHIVVPRCQGELQKKKKWRKWTNKQTENCIFLTHRCSWLLNGVLSSVQTKPDDFEIRFIKIESTILVTADRKG